jgi:hypothetical protein
MNLPYAICKQTGEQVLAYQASSDKKYIHCDFIHPFLEDVPVVLVNSHKRRTRKGTTFVRSFFRMYPRKLPYRVVVHRDYDNWLHQKTIYYLSRWLAAEGVPYQFGWSKDTFPKVLPNNELHIPDLITWGNVGTQFKRDETWIMPESMVVFEIQRSGMSRKTFARRMDFYAANDIPVVWIFWENAPLTFLKKFFVKHFGGYYIFEDYDKKRVKLYYIYKGEKYRSWLPWSSQTYYLEKELEVNGIKWLFGFLPHSKHKKLREVDD